jgi:hypothetical protein
MSAPGLYGNSTAPQLIWETLLPALSWLPGNIMSYLTTSPNTFQIILNVLLVYAGARTSALLHDLDQYTPFITSLNNALSISHQGSFNLTITRCDVGEFIYRQNNPNFIKLDFSDYIIGHNLDFFTPGNIHEWDERHGFQLYESTTRTHVTGEVIPSICMDQLGTRDYVQKHMNEKVKKFNEAFRELELPYRFAWSETLYPQIEEETTSVMTSDSAPPAEWWNRNAIHIAHSTFGGGHGAFRTLFLDADKNWDAITTLWRFTRKIMDYRKVDMDIQAQIDRVLDGMKDVLEKGIEINVSNVKLQLGKLEAEMNSRYSKKYSKTWERWKGWGIMSWMRARFFVQYILRRRRWIQWMEGPVSRHGLNCSVLHPGYYKPAMEHFRELVYEIISSFPLER